MLKKATRNQILKKINKEDAFKNDTTFYLPINVSKSAIEFFEISSIVVTYLPKIFYKSQSLSNITPVERNENKGFRKKDKPLYINKLSKNSNFFELSNIEEESSSNKMFKKIYSKNIVASFGQEEFLSDVTPVDFVFNSNEDEITVFCRTSLEKIESKTCQLENQPGDSRIKKTYHEMIIKAYALNNKNEVVDKIEIESKKLSEYTQRTNNEATDLILIENNLSFFAQDFNFILDSYVFPIAENTEDIRGPYLDFDISLLNDIFDNNEELEYFNDNIRNIRITLSCRETGKNIILKDFNSRTSDYFQIRQNNRILSRSLLDREDYISFITSSFEYIHLNDLEYIPISYSFNLSYTTRDIVIEKFAFYSKEKVIQSYNDILSYKFEKDISSGEVINIELTKFSNKSTPTFAGLDISALARLNNIYKVKINLNTASYLRSQITESQISFNFYDLQGNIISNIEEFYFDENLTKDNSLTTSMLPLDSIFFNENTKNIFFRSLSIIEKVELFFHVNNQNKVSVGFFDAKNLLVSRNRISKNIYDECSLKFGNNITSNYDRNNFLIGLLLNESSAGETFILDMNSIIGDVSFKNVGYFKTNENASSDERLQEVLNNTMVKVTKVLKINNLELNAVSKYFFLSQICSELNQNKTIINTDSLPIMDFDIRNRISQNSIILNNYNCILSRNYTAIVGDFHVDYKIFFDFAVLNNNTVISFGETSEQNFSDSRTNLINFISSNNENFQMTETLRLLENVYNLTFFSNKESIIEKIYDLSEIKNSIDYTHSILSSKQDLLNNIQQNEDILRDTVFISDYSKIYDFTFSNVLNNRNRILIGKENNRLTLSKRKKNLAKISGINVTNLLRSFRSYNNSSIVSAFCLVDYQYKNVGLSSSEKEDLKNAGFNLIESVTEKDCMFLTKENKNESIPLNVSISNDSIIVDIIRENIEIEKFSDPDFYDFLSNSIGSTTRKNNNTTALSRFDLKQKALIIKNLIIRLCIVFNINGKNNIILSNIIARPDNKFIRYVNDNAIVLQNNYLNLNIVDQDAEVCRPSIVYKGNIK